VINDDFSVKLGYYVSLDYLIHHSWKEI